MSLFRSSLLLGGMLVASSTPLFAATISIDPAQPASELSPYLTGACIEDVNHEIYGGLYSQMIFGESFQEPATPLPLVDFTSYGGNWTVQSGQLVVGAGSGPKLIYAPITVTNGETSVDVKFSSDTGGNAGFIVRVTDPAAGADAFVGYEISLAPAGYLVLGRHRQNWEPISQTACSVPLNQWITLRVTMSGSQLEVFVNGSSVVRYADTVHPLAYGSIGLRTWQEDARFRNFSITTNGVSQNIAFTLATNVFGAGVSGMWRPFQGGTATGTFGAELINVFVGSQSQRLTFTGGTGQVGMENEGLNRWGMYFVGGQPYEGVLWARAEVPTQLFVSLESSDGSIILAEQSIQVPANSWQRLAFTLTPAATNYDGRFAIKLKQPGSVVVGYAFLQPGDWGRFAGLPVRKDIANGLVNQGVTVLRYGGSMVNAAQYRWKNMVGPRDQRPPYAGTWYPYSSDGWGIFDFLNFCEAAGILGIPDLNVNESAQDMADFIDYVNGSTNTIWGAKRAADGHPKPYGLQHIELGNEERVDSNYLQKFQSLAQTIWAKDTNIILVVGDFVYSQVITNPFSFSGGASGITTLAPHQSILQLARQYGAEVWFDTHVWTDGPLPDSSLQGTLSYADALDQLAQGAKHKPVVFELNAGNYRQRRALANAVAINALERDGRFPVVTSANCLQPDGQNDNGWDQGLLFLNSSNVWLQPPGYVTRMFANHHQRFSVQSSAAGAALDVAAERSEDSSILVLRVVNGNSASVPVAIQLGAFVPDSPLAAVEQLSADLDAGNSAANPFQVVPALYNWSHGYSNGAVQFNFAANSVTIMQFHGSVKLPQPPNLVHRWSFNGASSLTQLADSVGNVTNGWLHGAAHLDGNGSLILPGSSHNDYAELPRYLLNNYTAVTFEFWVSFGTNPQWGRLLDFGDTNASGSGCYCVDFTPHSGFSPNGINFEASGTDPGSSAIQNVTATPVLDNLGKIHLVLVWDSVGQYLAVYTNGVVMARKDQVTLPISAIRNVHSYLGKSSYANDSCGVATIDEFRIYDSAMTQGQIAASFTAGPDVYLFPGLSISKSGNGSVISWPGFIGGSVQSSPSLGSDASWTTPPQLASPVLSNGLYQLTVPTSNPANFFRLVQ